MRTRMANLAALIASLSGAAPMAAAQIGEFPLQMPGPIVHRGWELQDEAQRARSEIGRPIAERRKARLRRVEFCEASSRWRHNS
jgi:hypothetical protein